MALIDEVKARYADDKLVQLTQKDSTSATTIDDTVLGYAATDVEANFPIHAGVNYDGTDARHVATAVEGVVTLLQARNRGLLLEQDEGWRRWIEHLKSLGMVTGRNRIVPKSNSQFTSDRYERQQASRFGPRDMDWLQTRSRPLTNE
jgi:hypothetical protein